MRPEREADATPLGGLPSIRLVVPCFNEAARLDLAAYAAHLESDPRTAFTFVDDGSMDGTRALLEGFTRSRPDRCRVLALDRNQGKGAAVRAGLLDAVAGGDEPLLGFWDADLATPLDAIALLARRLDARPELVLAMGARVQLLGHDIRRRPLRHYLGRVFATGASLALGLAVYDTQCGAKLFRRSPELDFALAAPFGSRWVFDVEMIARVCRQCRATGTNPADRIAEVPLPAWRDVGTSKVRARDFFVAALDLVRIARRHRSAPRRS